MNEVESLSSDVINQLNSQPDTINGPYTELCWEKLQSIRGRIIQCTKYINNLQQLRNEAQQLYGTNLSINLLGELITLQGSIDTCSSDIKKLIKEQNGNDELLDKCKSLMKKTTSLLSDIIRRLENFPKTINKQYIKQCWEKVLSIYNGIVQCKINNHQPSFNKNQLASNAKRPNLIAQLQRLQNRLAKCASRIQNVFNELRRNEQLLDERGYRLEKIDSLLKKIDSLTNEVTAQMTSQRLITQEYVTQCMIKLRDIESEARECTIYDEENDIFNDKIPNFNAIDCKDNQGQSIYHRKLLTNNSSKNKKNSSKNSKITYIRKYTENYQKNRNLPHKNEKRTFDIQNYDMRNIDNSNNDVTLQNRNLLNNNLETIENKNLLNRNQFDNTDIDYNYNEN